MKPPCGRCGHSFEAHQLAGETFILMRCNAASIIDGHCWCDGYEAAIPAVTRVAIPFEDRQAEYSFMQVVYGPETREFVN
jgi:hypothetical protein